ncbi:lipocalin family protein [uncultured Algibacter sp.]|uniref:lipocalin family protein n=1 Tax=uncultured Algibacter sp. TaxID=298659 RepID=UPI00262DFDF1|nr:lipocalin family protein [uncultured Algibacter sp.]
MKPIRFTVLLCLFLGMQLSAQSSQLVGTWLFDYQASYNGLSQEKKTVIDDLQESIGSSLEEQYSNCKLEIRADGTYTQILQMGKEEEGVWAYDSTKNLMVLTNTSSSSQKQQIKQLTGNTLHLEALIKDSMGNILPADTWCYTK